MPSVSGRTNPTGRKDIARKHVSIAVREVNGSRVFEIVALDLNSYGFASGLPLIVIATAGSTRIRTEVGTTSVWQRGPFSLDELDFSQILRFRLLVSEPGTAKLVGSAEGIRPVGDGDADSMIPIETADLGELLWQLDILDEMAVLKVNVAVYPTGASAQNNVAFQALVVPEALRQVLAMLASEPERLTSEESPWKEWVGWLADLGFEPPFGDIDKDQWVREVVGAFCSKHRFATDLRTYEAARSEQT